MDPAGGSGGGDTLKPGRGRARGRGRPTPTLPLDAVQGPSTQDVATPTGGAAAMMGAVSLSEPPTLASGERATEAPKDRRFDDDEQRKRWMDFLRSRDFMKTRPAHMTNKQGEGGRPIALVGNYFEVQLRKMEQWKLYQYRVDFEPDQDSKRIRKALMRQVEELQFIYDGGHMLFSTAVLPVDPFIKDNLLWKERKDGGAEVLHTVTLRRARDIAWNDAEMIQFYNIVMRTTLEKLNLTLLGRFYYDPKLLIKQPQHRLEIWPGYKTMMRPYENKLLLNIEMVSKVIRTDTILKMMSEMRAEGGEIKRRIEAYFVGSIVMTKFNCKTYRVGSIDWNSRVTHSFPTKSGEVTFLDYYKNKYGITITDMGQPLLVIPPTKQEIRRGEITDKRLVPELCVLTGLTDDMRNNFTLMRELKNHLIVEPQKRVQQLQTFMKRIVDQADLRTEMIEKWGLRYPNNAMIEIPSRVLNPESLVFARNQNYTDPAKPADWTNAFRSRQVYKAEPCKNWAIISPQRNSGHLDLFISTLQKVATPMGYSISQPVKIIISAHQMSNYQTAIDQVVAQCKGAMDMIFVVLPNNGAPLYSAIKQRCAVQYGISSQCCLAKNVEKSNMSVCTKIAIQMCAKQGGAPWSCANPLAKFNLMVAGYDVYHAGGFSPGKQSVGALVASLNPTLTQYTSVVRMGQKYELSPTMQSDFTIILQRFQKANSCLPGRILFYRDGVGEGQLDAVITTEVSGLTAAINEIYTKSGQELPKFSFIVVSKRINARFYVPPDSPQKQVENPPPGAVIDNVVTLPERYDFYLVSQIARQGTVSPTSYNVIHESGPWLTASQMQLFTYKMCHMYYNWSGTVSVPGVCQYAHKLAYLTGLSYLENVEEKLENLLHFL